MTQSNKPPRDGNIQITYREDGDVPMAIWLVWLGFAIFAAYYLARWTIPDFLRWMAESRM